MAKVKKEMGCLITYTFDAILGNAARNEGVICRLSERFTPVFFDDLCEIAFIGQPQKTSGQECVTHG